MCVLHAILTRKAIYTERKVKGLWKSQEVKLFANAAYEWLYGSRKQAFSYCEQALYLMCVDDLDNQQKPIEQEIEKYTVDYVLKNYKPKKIIIL